MIDSDVRPKSIASQTPILRRAGSRAFLRIAGLLVALSGSALVALTIWTKNPEGSLRFVRMTLVSLSAATILSQYVLFLPRLLDEKPRARIGMRQLLLVVTATVVMSAFGFALDALVLILFVLYIFAVGRFGKGALLKINRRLISRDLLLLSWTSTVIIATFVLCLTAIGLACALLPYPYAAWVPFTVIMSLWPSALFAWLFILGDNASSGFQLAIYGLPVGIPLNLAASGFAGSLSAIAGLKLQKHGQLH
jgi:hypothetical protein